MEVERWRWRGVDCGCGVERRRSEKRLRGRLRGRLCGRLRGLAGGEGSQRRGQRRGQRRAEGTAIAGHDDRHGTAQHMAWHPARQRHGRGKAHGARGTGRGALFGWNILVRNSATRHGRAAGDATRQGGG